MDDRKAVRTIRYVGMTFAMLCIFCSKLYEDMLHLEQQIKIYGGKIT